MMTATTITTPAITAMPGAVGHRRAGHRHAGSWGRWPRLLAGLALGALTIAAMTCAALVIVLHIGFAPVLSPSMEPDFAAGDLLLTHPTAATQVRVGQVVVLPRPDAPGQRYAHRIIAVDHSQGAPVVRTKGDANTSADPQPLKILSDTVPVVAGHIPGIGRVALLGQHSWIKIALIVLIGSCALIAAKRALMNQPR
jgi:signal peptidase